mgnify:CR=1 FL=1
MDQAVDQGAGGSSQNMPNPHATFDTPVDDAPEQATEPGKGPDEPIVWELIMKRINIQKLSYF